jgi:hypothetical protein
LPWSSRVPHARHLRGGPTTALPRRHELAGGTHPGHNDATWGAARTGSQRTSRRATGISSAIESGRYGYDTANALGDSLTEQRVRTRQACGSS